ncbi:hypothetical protein ALI144C_32830 [Actinosynnema sp. ALI-1.44]|uniref:CD225/dispanin family protein n=1 Tax=Actinosynnema sp. ALI-1.44 TaxID=1933779 RepID=UPI00097C9BCE|nr:CD225/dispanin family protein [Actinosynnema sp. ALI-1.44]ONI76914.1 hypothetical protein ALI144C_32830 [Actinosynnema sp. ALI-1.44]
MAERPQDPVPSEYLDAQQQTYQQPFAPYPQQPGYPPPPGYQPMGYPQPGYPPPYGYPAYLPQQPPPPNYLGWAIGAIFLFWPVAIAALIKSGQVERYWAMGQPDLARQASDSTKTLCVVATVIGGVMLVFGFLMFFFMLNAFSRYGPI